MEKFFGNLNLEHCCKFVHSKVLLVHKKNRKLSSTIGIYFSVCSKASYLYLKVQIATLHRCFFQIFVFFFSISISIKLIKCLVFFSSRKKKIFGFFFHNLFLNNIFSLFSVYSTMFSSKDLDGISFKNQYLDFFFKPSVFSCTTKSILKIIKLKKKNLRGLCIIIVNVSNIIGVPLIREFLREGAFISVFKEVSSKLCQQLMSADIFITSSPRFMLFGRCLLIKKELILIDVATISKKNKIVGNFSLCTNLFKKNIYLTTVPGGVGPITTSYFLINVLILFLKCNSL